MTMKNNHIHTGLSKNLKTEYPFIFSTYVCIYSEKYAEIAHYLSSQILYLASSGKLNPSDMSKYLQIYFLFVMIIGGCLAMLRQVIVVVGPLQCLHGARPYV